MSTDGDDYEELEVVPPNTNNNNNNDNNRELIVEEGPLFYLLYWATLEYVTIIPGNLRRVIELFFISQAVFFMFVLMYVHVQFFQEPAGCFDLVKDIWPRDGVLRVEIIESLKLSVDTSEENSLLINRFIETYSPENKREVDIEASTEELAENIFQENYNKLFKYLSFKSLINFKELFSSTTEANRQNTSKSNLSIVKDLTQFRSTKYSNNFIRGVLGIVSILHSKITNLSFINDHKVKLNENYIVEYSLNEEYLILSPSARNRSGIPVMIVTLDITHNKCYGDSLSQFYLKYFLDYDHFILWFVNSISGNKGFIRYVISGENYNLGNISMYRTRYLVSFLIMLVFTQFMTITIDCMSQLVSSLIECSGQQLGLQQSIMFLLPDTCKTFLALFCMDCVMSRFFNEPILSCIELIFILSDQYYKICSCCPITKKYFPVFFFVYHYLFYAYYIRFYGLHDYLTLSCSWLFIQHSMIFFYHHYVLPLMLQRAYLMQRRVQRQQQPQDPRQLQDQSFRARLKRRVDILQQRLVQLQ